MPFGFHPQVSNAGGFLFLLVQILVRAGGSGLFETIVVVIGQVEREYGARMVNERLIGVASGGV